MCLPFYSFRPSDSSKKGLVICGDSATLKHELSVHVRVPYSSYLPIHALWIGTFCCRGPPASISLKNSI